MENHHDLRLTALTFFTSAGSVPSMRYLKIGVIYVSPSFSTIANTSVVLMDFSFSSSTSTCLLKCAKLVDAILLNATAFLFSLLGTYLIKNTLKLLVNFIPYGLVSINPTPKPSVQEDLSVNKIYGLGSSSASSIRVSRESSSGRSTMNVPATSSLDNICCIGWTALTVSFASARYTMSSSFSIGATNMGSSERIEMTKRSKNDQKPTKNERDKNKSEESARDHSRISPTQSKKETRKSKTQDKVKGPRMPSIQRFKGLCEVLKIKG
ncbi:hypothetical protein Tco_0821661 [Tanacetum coccineum]|uniref:Uncharacterized protein n=1 Tax=Tanacetum coccineum TaxID=301880 RepID=A0ABQ5AG09_9ASTR